MPEEAMQQSLLQAAVKAVVKESPIAPEREIPAAPDELLTRILSHRRMHDSPPEKAFGKWLLELLKKIKHAKVVNLPLEQFCVNVGQSDTLFSCHIDTMDMWKEGDSFTQKVLYDPNFGDIFLDEDSGGSCLGADDGVGIWIMISMIKKKIPGCYIFHRGEERGGLGAREVLTAHGELLKKYKRSIAFDRPNDYEVIIDQGGLKCASITFGEALARALNKLDPLFKYTTSTRGVFTDNKLYRSKIAEVVNLGVGYQSQHTKKEVLKYPHALALMEACLKVDWEGLPTVRDPLASDPIPPFYNGGGGYASGRSLVGNNHDFRKSGGKSKVHTPTVDILDELEDMGIDDIETWATEDPAAAASLLAQLAVEVSASRARIKMLSKLLGF